MRLLARGAAWVLMLAGSAGCGFAQISLSSAVSMALHNDPRVKMAQADAQKASAALAEAQDAYIPIIGASGGYGKSVGVPLGVPVAFSLNAQSLVYNFSQRDNIRAAAQGVQAAMLALQDTRAQVTEDAVTTYLTLDADQQRQSALQQEYNFAERLVSIVGDRLHAGRDTQIELLKARRLAVQIHLAMTHNDEDMADQSDHLARIIGLSGGTVHVVQSSIPALPPIRQIPAEASDSLSVQGAFANARSKQEKAFGEARHRFLPQVSFGANYSRIDLAQSEYLDYYPGFTAKSNNAYSAGIQIQIPLFDRSHEAHAQQAAADATHARYEAERARSQFLEGNLKLQHSMSELADRIELAEIERDLAQEQVNVIVAELSADNADAPIQMTPKDEQNARVQERARFIDLLDVQTQLQQVEIKLLRSTGQLDNWLNTSVSLTPTPAAAPAGQNQH